MSMAHFAFLGYSHRSNEHVLSIAKILRTRGVEYWLDTEQIHLGDNILGRMQEGLNKATVVVAFFGPEGVDGKWQELEILTALDQSLRSNKKIIPVLLPGAVHSANLPSFLQGVLHVNLRTTNDSEELDRLVTAILASDPAVDRVHRRATPRLRR